MRTLLVLVLLVPQSDPLTFQVDGSKRSPISPFVYGINFPDWGKMGWDATITRAGGNRMTAYNWETNASNAGADWHHQNDNIMACEPPGEAMRRSVEGTHGKGASIIITIPTIGRVAADKNGGGDVKQTPDYLNKRFHLSLAKKDGPFADPPDLTDGKVYQDEFVAWLEKKFPKAREDAKRTIFYALDNEPDIWSHTHARIHPQKVRFDELAQNNIEYASMVKRVAPKALVFGFVSYGWHGFTTLQDAPDRNGRDFTDFYLQEMSAAEKKAGKRLVDVLDIHWYPEARGDNKRVCDDDTTPGVAAARIQSARSLWDPTYKESSWVVGPAGGPIRLLPRMREKIEKHYPGTKLAITEYYFGAGDHISGGLAQADVLGIFGREGVFAATLWHLGRSKDTFIHGAFAMFRNFDGAGGSFGDTGLAVTGGDPARASLYASVDDKKRLVLVALNKTDGPLPVRIERKDLPSFRTASVYRLTSADPKPVAQPELAAQAGPLMLELPPLSVSTIVLRP